ncbi:MAG TPA: hypothetical protein VH092_24610, partial [Urbifossiella sp.]|nr:hypothetical protein [Urbifossiella sp.]
MCVGLSLAYSEVPLLLIERYGLQERLHDRGGEKEVRFLWQARPTWLPVWWNGKIHVIKWGNRIGPRRS